MDPNPNYKKDNQLRSAGDFDQQGADWKRESAGRALLQRVQSFRWIRSCVNQGPKVTLPG
jgi:hypothetical protein